MSIIDWSMGLIFLGVFSFEIVSFVSKLFIKRNTKLTGDDLVKSYVQLQMKKRYKL